MIRAFEFKDKTPDSFQQIVEENNIFKVGFSQNVSNKEVIYKCMKKLEGMIALPLNPLEILSYLYPD